MDAEPEAHEPMLTRTKNRFKFLLERMILRGTHFRLLAMVAHIGLVSLTAGVLVLEADLGFGDAGEAVWWAFLRLTDPGYLGDDEGALKRIVSTAVTVLGYVIFMGALIAIMTQWLHQTIEKLESGLTPIAQNDHILILGWTNRTPSIVQQLVLFEERVKRFLRRHGTRTLRVVILAAEVTSERMHELRGKLGPRWDPHQVLLRSGTPLRIDHLRRVDFLNASAILLPGADFAMGGADFNDTRTIKTLLSISHHGLAQGDVELPLLVTEIFDPRKVSVARRAYDGPVEVLASNSLIGRLIAQNVRHRGLSYVFAEILAHGEGNEIYVRTCPQFAGMQVQDLTDFFPEAILLGAVRPDGKSFFPLLNPAGDFVLAEGDRLVLLARCYDDTSPEKGFEATPVARPMGPEHPAPLRESRRILVLGWNHKVPALVQEFGGYPSESFEIDVLSTFPAEKRQEDLESQGLHIEGIRVRQLEGDYTVPSDLARARPETYDNVVLMGSDRLDTGEESDARTILGYLLLRDHLTDRGGEAAILVELMDPENIPLFQGRSAEILISPLVLSHMLAQVALRRELRAVFDELFGPGGAEISFHPASDYDITGVEVSVSQLREAAARRDEIALGVRIGAEDRSASGGVYLNPEADSRWNLKDEDELVVLATYT